MTRIAARGRWGRRRADPRRGTYTARARAPARARGPRFGAGACWAPGGGPPAMSVAGTVVRGAAQGRTPLLCARAARGLGRPRGPGPGPGPVLGLGLSLVLALVPAHDPARARGPHRTLRIPGDALGPDPTAGAVGAIVGMISGTADLARPIQKVHDGRRNSTMGPLFCYTSKSFPDTMVLFSD